MLPRTFPTRLATTFLAVSTAFALGSTVTAQGTGGAFPDPVSSSTVDRFAELLGIDAAERAELAPFHEAYLAKLRELREGPIAEWLKANGGMGGGMFGSSRPRAEIEEAVRKREQLLGQIEKAERELVDRIATGLPPEQAERIERVRRYAVRERARGTLGTFGGGALSQVELRELVDKLELDEAARLAVEPVLDDYERRLTKSLEGMAERAVRQPLAMSDAIAAAGLKRPQALEGDGAVAIGGENAGEVEKYFREVSRVRSEVTAPQREARVAIAKLSRDTVGRIRPLVPEEAGDRLMDAFVQRAYVQISADGVPAGSVLKSAMTLAEKEGADASLRDALTLLRKDWRTRYDGVLKDLMEEVDSARVGLDLFRFTGPGEEDPEMRKHDARMQELSEKRRTINEGVVEQARALLGPALAEKLGGEGLRPEGAGEFRTAGVMVMEGGDGIEVMEFDGGEMVVAVAGGDLFAGAGSAPLPKSLDGREITELAERLGLDESQRPILEVMHGEYEVAYNRARDEAAQELADAGPKDKAEPAGGGAPAFMPQPMDEQTINRRYAAFRRGVERLMAVDRTFFDDVLAVMQGTPAAPGIAAAQAARERSVLQSAGRGPGGPMMFGMAGPMGGREADVDLGRVVESLPADAQPMAAPIVARWMEAATGAARQRFDTCITAQKDIDLFHAKAMKVGEGGNVELNIDSNDSGFAAMEKAQRQIAEAAGQAASINRASRDEVLAVLPEALRTEFRRAYARVAWPMVYRDRADARAKVQAALALADLDPGQRPKIEALLVEHLAAYEGLCDRMVEAESTATSSGGLPDAEGVRALTARQNEMKKLRFERTERNAATLRALGGMLTPEQVQTIGGVAMPEEKPRGIIQFGG